MKKVKALVVILTVALMAMGIGYAAWSDQINMTATAKTGHLDVTWIDAKVHSGKTYGDLSANTDFKQKFAFTKGEVNGYEYDNVGIYNKNDKVVVTLRDLYPGAHIRVDLTGKNNSTMAVRPESMTVRCISGQSLYEQIGVKAVLDYKDANNVKHSVTIQDQVIKFLLYQLTLRQKQRLVLSIILLFFQAKRSPLVLMKMKRTALFLWFLLTLATNIWIRNAPLKSELIGLHGIMRLQQHSNNFRISRFNRTCLS